MVIDVKPVQVWNATSPIVVTEARMLNVEPDFPEGYRIKVLISVL